MTSVHGYELITEWRNSQCGKIAKARRGAKTYFLKKYQTPVQPVMNGALDKKTFDANKKQFEKFVSNRKKVNNTLRSIAGTGGNIVIPTEEFIDENHYIEVSEFVDGAVEDDDLEGVLSKLPVDVKKLLMLTAAGAIVSIHRKGIVHSDLKLKNVLLARNSYGNYVAKLIDFDNSYFLDNKPEDDIVGDINYYSPELGAYADSEDEDRSELAAALTDRSDIFSLGLIFHYYLSGELPHAKTLNERLQRRKDKGKAIYCWSVLNNGCELELSDTIRSVKYLSLIKDMLDKDPANRPNAIQVLQRLKEPDDKLVDEGGVWHEHHKPSHSAVAVSEDIIPSVEDKFAAPWPEHQIELNETKLRDRGFVGSKQAVFSDIKGYNIFRADGSFAFFNMEKLVAMGYAKNVSKADKSEAHPVTVREEKPFLTEKTTAPSTASVAKEDVVSEEKCADKSVVKTSGEGCWEEHGIEIDFEIMKARGYINFEKTIQSGIKGYLFTRSDGTTQFIRVESLLILKIAKKK